MIGFGWQVISARLLDVSEFGLVAVVTSVTSFAVIAISVGGDEVMTSARAGEFRQTFLRELRIRGASSALCVVVALILTSWSPLMAIACIYSVATALSYLCVAYFTRQYNATLSIVGVASQAIVLAGFFAAVVPQTALEVIAILTLSTVVRALVMLATALIFGVRDSQNPARRATTLKRLSLMASSASTPLLGRQLHVMLAATLGVSLAGIGAYSAAYTLAYMAATVTILGIGATTMPRLADAASRGHAHIAPEWKRVLISTSGLSLPAVVLSMAVAPSLMSAIYGPEYGELGAMLYIGISAVLIIQRLTGGGATNALLIATDKAGLLLMSILGSAVALAVTDLLLMPFVGIWGAIFGSAVAAITGAAVTLMVVHRNHKTVPPVRPQLTVLVTSLLVGLPLFAVELTWDVNPWIILGVAGFAGVILLLATRRGMQSSVMGGRS